MRIFLFAIIAVTIIGTASYYIYRRLVGSFPLKPWQRNLIRLLIAGIVLAMPVSIALRRHGLENTAGDWLAWGGYVSLGFLSFIFTLMVIRDGQLSGGSRNFLVAKPHARIGGQASPAGPICRIRIEEIFWPSP